MLSIQQVKSAMPPALKSSVTDDLVDTINDASEDPEALDIIRENFITYSNVLEEGKFKLQDYLKACKYVSYKMMGYNNREAYQRTSPEKYQELVARGASDKTINAFVHGYSRGKLVNEVLKRTLIPSWVLNQDVYQEAINEQASLMRGAKSELVRMQAANSILTHLKQPEVQQVDVNIGVKETAGLVDLRNMLSDLAEKQIEAIENGVPTRDITHQSIIDVTPTDDAEIVPEPKE